MSIGLVSRGGACLAVATVAVWFLSTAANATLIGDQVRIQIASVDTTFVVASATTPDFSVSSFNWNVESSSIDFFVGNVVNSTLAPNVFFTLSDLDWVGSPASILVSASIVSATGLFSSATDSILTIGDHSITVDLSSFANGDLSGSPGIRIALVTGVPEPGTLWLAGVGLAGLAFARRRTAGAGKRVIDVR
jgi:hypothetical protein